MYFVVDRIEKDTAVCEKEDGSMINIKVSLLPEDVKEGDAVVEKNGVYVIDREMTQELRRKAIEMTDKVFGNG